MLCATEGGPDIIGADGPFCVNDPTINLNTDPSVSGTFSGTGVTDGAGSTGTFSPSAAGAGTHTVSFTPAGCPTAVTMLVTVYPTVDPTFAIPQAICENSSAWNASTVISTINPISLTTAITVPGNLAALGFTAANITDWYGDGVTDNGATASFTPLLTSGSAQTGTYTICVDVGYSLGCTQTHCQTILVTPQPNPTIVSRTVCVGSLPATVDLTVMFSNVPNNPTTPGGSWNLTGGSGTGSTNGDILTLTAAGTSTSPIWLLPKITSAIPAMQVMSEPLPYNFRTPSSMRPVLSASKTEALI